MTTPLFAVEVLGGDERAREALMDAGLGPAGPPRNQSGEIIIPWVCGFVRANDAEAARERVEENLPPDGDYVIERVHRLETA
jgi:hypothetical protein